MNTLAVVSFALALVAANANLLPLHETGTLLKGPSARSTIVGADGLGVSTVFEGGVVAPTHEVAVAVPEVVVARAEPIIAHPAPLLTHVEPIIARHEPLITPLIPTVPVWEHGRSDIIAGPSGTIITNKDYDIAPLVPARREIFVEPAVRTILPLRGDFAYGRSFDLRPEFLGFPRSAHFLNSYLW